MNDLVRNYSGSTDRSGNTFGDMFGDSSNDVSTGAITVQVNPRISDIVARYLEHRVQDVGFLLNALNEGEFERIQDVAHDLVGTGGSFGFEGMSLIGRSLETAAVNRHTAEIKILVEGLAEYISRVEVVYE